jgi:Uma2 family endonuclease
MSVPEYWLIDPVMEQVTTFTLESEQYREIGVFTKHKAIISIEPTDLQLSAEQIFATES